MRNVSKSYRTLEQVQLRRTKTFLTVLGFVGGLLWIVSGIILSVAPAGNPPASYRTPAIDIRPQLAIGLLLIGISMGKLVIIHRINNNRHLSTASFITMAAGVIYVCGRLIRNIFLNTTGWEPLLPLGFIGFVAGLYYMGVIALKHKVVSRLVSILLIATATFLLFFNDQYLPWMAIPFGLGVIILCSALGFSVVAPDNASALGLKKPFKF